MKASRRGFSLVEMLIVVVMISVLTLLAVPKVALYQDRTNVNAARERIESAISTARAAAIHKGHIAFFHTSGNWMSVWTWDQVTGAMTQQVSWINLNTLYSGVNVQVGGSGWSSVYFEPRGVTWTSLRPPSTVVFRVVGKTRSDSVCVSRTGQILPRGCTL